MLCTSNKKEKKKKDIHTASPKKMPDKPETLENDVSDKKHADTGAGDDIDTTDKAEITGIDNTNEIDMDFTSKLDQLKNDDSSEDGEPETESKTKPVKIEQVVEDIEDDPLSEHVDRLAIAELLSTTNDDVDGERDDFEISEDMLVQYMRKGDTKRLKQVLRGGDWGPRHGMRKNLWRHMCRHLHKAADHDEFSELAEELFPSDDTSDQEIHMPSYVDIEQVNSYYLSTDGIIKVKKVLNVIEHYKPDIVHCPLLFSLVSLFMHYKTESDSYNSAYALLRSKESAFITQTNVAYDASKLVIRDLAKKHAKSGYVHLVRQSSNIDTVFDTWLWWIFQDLPFSHLLHIMDCYLHEGMKVLYRVALAVIILYGKMSAKKATQSPNREKSSATVVQSLRQFCREIPVKPDKLLKTGFSIRGLSRKEIRKLQVKHEMYLHSRKHLHGNDGGGDVANGNKMIMSKSFSGPIILQNTGSNMLNLDLLFTIWTWLPTRFAVCQPMLLYTSEEHGTSLVTLYQMIENQQPTVIVIKNTNNEIFGAFCSAPWRDRRQRGPHLSYFGTGETFLFTLSPEKKKYSWVGLSEEDIPNTANMFQAGDRHILTIGGGHGEAISLDESLLHCRTERCDTFNNEPLCCTEDFTCKVVEVYGFQ